MEKQGWAVWITGLPGSGKSSIAKALEKTLKKNKIEVLLLNLDSFRKKIVPEPKYTEDERDLVYNTLIFMTEFLTLHELNVIIDATGHRKKWRDSARTRIKNFIEVYVKCPLEICMQREATRKNNLVMRSLYKKALKRLKIGKQYKGLGEIIGIDVPYEENENAEIIIESEKVKPNEAAKLILKKLGV